MAIPLNDNTRILAPKPSDPRYFANDNTPWASIVDVNAGLPIGERHEGLTVNIAGVEYWWKYGEWTIKNPSPSLQTVLNTGNNSTTNIVVETTDTIAIDSYSENNIGVYGSSDNNYGVQGNSSNNIGVFAYSANGIGLFGHSANGNASIFDIGLENTNNITEWKKVGQNVASISHEGQLIVKKSIKIDSDEPLDAKYLNGKVAYASLAEANALIPIGIRSPYLTIVVQGAEYWWADGAWGIKKDTYISVTKAELDTLIANNGLETGFPYKITGVHPDLYGGTTIYSKAIDRNKIEINAIGTFYTPKYDAVSGSGIWTGYVECSVTNVVGLFDNNELITANNGATGQLFGNVNGGFITPLTGSWSGATSITGNASGATASINNVSVPLTYAIGAKTIWGGYHWTNLTGNLGSKVDDLNLDSTNWSKIAFNSTDYNISYDEITYDYANDFISGRKDALGNDVSFTFEDSDNFLDNGIRYFMWGNQKISGNFCLGAFINVLNFRGGSIKFSEIKNYVNISQVYFNQNSFIFSCTFQKSASLVSCEFGMGSSINNCIFSQASSIANCTIPPNKSIQFATFELNASINNVSLTTATEIFATYPRTVFGVSKIRYYNNNNVLVIADITD